MRKLGAKSFCESLKNLADVVNIYDSSVEKRNPVQHAAVVAALAGLTMFCAPEAEATAYTVEDGTKSDYSYTTTGGTATSYKKVVVDPDEMKTSSSIDWTQSSESGTSGYTWKQTSTPSATNIHAVTSGSNLQSVDGAVRFYLPKNGSNELQYYAFNYSNPYSVKQSRISNLGGNVSNRYFYNNSSSSYGGAIYYEYQSYSTRYSILADFIGNSSKRGGGAIYLYSPSPAMRAKLSSVTGNFIGNSGGSGGAINSYNGEISTITGDFIGNSATSGEGGAIENQSSSVIGTITGDFIGNSANDDGGAIDNIGTIGTITGDFIGNSAKSRGGAINNHYNTISLITDATFMSNSAQDGGAIYNTASINAIVDSSFINNYAKGRGGAIYSNKDLTIVAEDTDVLFTGNKQGVQYDSDGNYIEGTGRSSDLYFDGTRNLYLNASDGRTMTFDGTIQNGVLHINNPSKGYGTNGTIVLNNTINGQTAYLYDGALKLGKSGSIGALVLEGDSTFDISNNKINNITTTLNNNTLNIALDVHGTSADTLYLNDANGSVNITDITFMDAPSNGAIVRVLQNATKDTSLILSSALANIDRDVTVTYNGEILSDNVKWSDKVYEGYEKYHLTGEVETTTYNNDGVTDALRFNNIVKTEIEKELHEGDIFKAVLDFTGDRTFSATSANEVLTLNLDYAGQSIGDGTLTINGIKDGNSVSTINANGHSLLKLESGDTLNLNTVKIQNAKTTGNGGAIDNNDAIVSITDTTFTNNKAGGDGGAIYNNNGTLNIQAINSDVLFQGNRAGVNANGTGGYSNAIAGNGTVNLNAAEGRSIIFNDGVASKLTVNNPSVRANSIGAVELNSNYIDVDLYSGVLKLGADAIQSSGVLTVKSDAALDIKNGVLNTVNTALAKNKTLDLRLDVDVDNLAADKLSLTNATGKVNITDINYLNGNVDFAPGKYIKVLNGATANTNLTLADNLKYTIYDVERWESTYVDNTKERNVKWSDEIATYTKESQIFEDFEFGVVSSSNNSIKDSLGYNLTNSEYTGEERIVDKTSYDTLSHIVGMSGDRSFSATSADEVYTLNADYAGQSIANGTLTINGVKDGDNISTIDANGHSFLQLESGDTLNLNTVKIQNAKNNSGGAIYSNGKITIINDSFLNNTSANNGGAIQNTNTIASIKDSTFTSNTANKGGGAIGNGVRTSVQSIADSTFTSNNALFGGAIFNAGEISSIKGSTFASNNSTTYGGAICNADYIKYNIGTSSGSVTYYTNGKAPTIKNITGSTFTENSASNGGGAIYNYTGNIISLIADSTFTSNTSTGDGGAIYNMGEIGGITDSTFELNKALNKELSFGGYEVHYGGAIYNADNGEINNISGSTFKNNSAGGNGGAIYNAGKIGKFGETQVWVADENGEYSGDNGSYSGSDGYYDGSDGYYDGSDGYYDGSDGYYDGSDGYYDGSDGYYDGSDGYYDGSDGYYDGSDGYYDGSDGYYDGSDGYYDGSDGYYDGSDGYSGDEETPGGSNTNNSGHYETIYTIEGGINNAIFEGNTAQNGGAIYNIEDGQIGEITNSIFTSNTTTNSGGAVYNEGLIAGIKDSTFTSNKVSGTGSGGAIYNSGTIGTSRITKVWVEGENADYSGDNGDYSGDNGSYSGSDGYYDGSDGYYDGSDGYYDGSDGYYDGSDGYYDGSDGYYDGSDGYYDGSDGYYDGSDGYYDGSDGYSGDEETPGGSETNTNGYYKNVVTYEGGITNTTFEGNTAEQGGAIYNTGTIADIKNSSFIGNSAKSQSANVVAKGGAIYSTKDLLISADAGQSVFRGNYTENLGVRDDNAIYLEGAKLTLDIKNGGSIVMKDNIRTTNNDVIIQGDDADTATFFLHNDIHNSNVYLKQITLNTINDQVHTNHFNSLTLEDKVNMAVDVDLRNEQMDRLTADSYTIKDGASLNVVGMSLMSDMQDGKDLTKILFADNGLKSHVNNQVTEVGGLVSNSYQTTAYTPIYRYNVAYTNEVDGGYYNFVRGDKEIIVVPDPVTPDPVNPDPVNPDPVNPDPVNPDPVNPDPVNPDPVNPDPVNPDPVNPDPVNPDPVNPDPVNPDPVNPDPVNPDPVNPDPVNPDPVNPDPVNPDPVNPDPVNPDPVNPDPVNPDPVNPDPGDDVNVDGPENFNPYTGIVTTQNSNPSSAFNPAVLASSAAIQNNIMQVNNIITTYAYHHVDSCLEHRHGKHHLSSRYDNRYAMSAIGSDLNSNNPLFVKPDHESVWVKPFVTFESIPLKNGPTVSATNYGTLIGFDANPTYLKRGWEGVFTGYAGYTGSNMRYSGNDVTSNGGLLGVTYSLFKGDFFTATTMTAGAMHDQARTMYGRDNMTTLYAGIGNKTGYNFNFKEGLFTIQPSLLLSYTFANTFNYTNAAGVRIESDPVHAIQIAPGVKFYVNTKSGWQPYIGVNMMWNIMDQTHVRANGVKLPEMSIKPYVQYGVGIQKIMKDNFTAYGQAMIQNGGRNGISLTAGFRWAIGRDKKKIQEVKYNGAPKSTKAQRHTLKG